MLVSEETWPELIAKGELAVVGLTMSVQRLERLGAHLRSGGVDRTVLDLVETATGLCRAQRQAADLTQDKRPKRRGGDVRALCAGGRCFYSSGNAAIRTKR